MHHQKWIGITVFTKYKRSDQAVNNLKVEGKKKSGQNGAWWPDLQMPLNKSLVFEVQREKIMYFVSEKAWYYGMMTQTLLFALCIPCGIVILDDLN